MDTGTAIGHQMNVRFINQVLDGAKERHSRWGAQHVRYESAVVTIDEDEAEDTPRTNRDHIGSITMIVVSTSMASFKYI